MKDQYKAGHENAGAGASDFNLDQQLRFWDTIKEEAVKLGYKDIIKTSTQMQNELLIQETGP